jgi:hypothetical protein
VELYKSNATEYPKPDELEFWANPGKLVKFRLPSTLLILGNLANDKVIMQMQIKSLQFNLVHTNYNKH